MKQILVFSAFALLASSCQNSSNEQGASQQKTEQTPPDGGAVYAQYCSGCHGDDGKMGLGGAKDLSASVLSQEEAKKIIAEGSANKKMMAYGKLLSEAELDQVSLYVMSLRK